MLHRSTDVRRDAAIAAICAIDRGRECKCWFGQQIVDVHGDHDRQKQR